LVTPVYIFKLKLILFVDELFANPIYKAKAFVESNMQVDLY